MAQLTLPIKFDHEDLQEMVEQAKREIAASCITKEQAKNMLPSYIEIEFHKMYKGNSVEDFFFFLSNGAKTTEIS